MCFKTLAELRRLNDLLKGEPSLVSSVPVIQKEDYRYFKTDLVCPDCEKRLVYREPKDYDPKTDEAEYLFLDQVYCKNCQKNYHYIDAFFYAVKKKEEKQ